MRSSAIRVLGLGSARWRDARPGGIYFYAYNDLGDEMPITRPAHRAPLDLPPVYRLVTLRAVGDAFAHAPTIAAEEGAGTLVYLFWLAHTGSRAAEAPAEERASAAVPEQTVMHTNPRIDLRPLTRGECDELAASYLGGVVANASLLWLWEVSAGNPLFVRELLVGARVRCVPLSVGCE